MDWLDGGEDLLTAQRLKLSDPAHGTQ